MLPIIALFLAQAYPTIPPLLPDDGWARGQTIKSETPMYPENTGKSKSPIHPKKRLSATASPCEIIATSDITKAIGYPIIEANRVSPGYGIRECLFRTNDPERYVIVTIGTYDSEKQANQVFIERTDGMSQSTTSPINAVIGLGRQARSVGNTIFERIQKSILSVEYQSASTHGGAEGSAMVARTIQPLLTGLP